MVLLLLSFLSFGFTKAQAQTAPHRQPIIEIANNGLFFFLHMALEDQAFVQKLKPDEKRMAQKIYDKLLQTSALRWFNENQIQSYPTQHEGKPAFLYGYVDAEEKIAKYISSHIKAPSLRFSNDREQFKNLRPGEGERAAKTTAVFDVPIDINLARLNSIIDPEFKNFDLGIAVSLLIHEYGHKLGPEKVQTLVDAVATALGDFIRGRTNVHPLKNGATAYSLHFNKFRFSQWMHEKNGTPELSVGGMGLPIFADQGVYAWIEQGDIFADLTKPLILQMKKKNLLKWALPEEDYYKFVKHSIFSVNSLKIEEVVPGRLEFKAVFTQGEIVMPFMVPIKSKDPKQIEFHKRYFWSDGRTILQPQSVDLKYAYNGTQIQFISKKERSMVTIDLPHLTVELLSSYAENTDLVVKLKVKGQKVIPANEGTIPISFTQAEIVIKSNNLPVTLTSKSYDTATEIFTFKIPRLYQIDRPELLIENVYLRPALTELIGNVHLRPALTGMVEDSFFTRVDVPLFTQIRIPVPSEAPIHVPVNFHDALVLKSVTASPDATRMRSLNLVFKTSEPLRSLSLAIKYKKSTFLAIEFQDQNEKLTRKQVDNVSYDYFADFTINEGDMKQQIINGHLHVEILTKRLGSLVSTTLLQQKNTGLVTNVSNLVVMVHPEIAIQSISAVTPSLTSVNFPIEKDIQFIIESQDPKYEKFKPLLLSPLFKNFIVKMCTGLF